MIDALRSALPGELAVLAQEGGQLERLEVMVQQHLRRIAHVPSSGQQAHVRLLADVVATRAFGR